ncbi:MAG: SBBP repeat-containing protein [Candidatus Kariarchaeaceae archaeon]
MKLVKKYLRIRRKVIPFCLIILLSGITTSSGKRYKDILEVKFPLLAITLEEVKENASNIDPFIFMSRIIGGKKSDTGREVVVDQEENIIVTGTSCSADFPVTINAYDTTFNGGTEFFDNDIFLMKLSSNGTLVFSTFFGGTADEWVRGIDVDSQGNIVIVGYTYSTDFPTFNNESTYSIDEFMESDVFISKFSTNGSLLWTHFLDGEKIDRALNVIIDSFDNIILTGKTESNDFPTTSNTYQPVKGEGSDLNAYDCFISKLSFNGSLLWSTYLGGTKQDSGYDISIDSQNNILVTGFTDSNDFPVNNGFSSSHSGESDVFISKLSSNGSQLLWSTFLGGSDNELGERITLDDSDNVLVAGRTSSDNFPIISAVQPIMHSSSDLFVTKLSSNGMFIIWSTYFGSNNHDYCEGIVVDPLTQDVTITGITTGIDFPIQNAYLSAKSGGFEDGFISEFSANGSLRWSTYFGGSSEEEIWGLDLDPYGKVIITGMVLSSDFPVTIDDSVLGSEDVFVCSLRDPLEDWILYEGFNCTIFDHDEDNTKDTLSIDLSLSTTAPVMNITAELLTSYKGSDGLVIPLPSNITSVTVNNTSSTAVSLSFTAETSQIYYFKLLLSSFRENIIVYEIIFSLGSNPSKSNSINSLFFIVPIIVCTAALVTFYLIRRKRDKT